MSFYFVSIALGSLQPFGTWVFFVFYMKRRVFWVHVMQKLRKRARGCLALSLFIYANSVIPNGTASISTIPITIS